jgi:hypothetical protein
MKGRHKVGTLEGRKRKVYKRSRKEREKEELLGTLVV